MKTALAMLLTKTWWSGCCDRIFRISILAHLLEMLIRMSNCHALTFLSSNESVRILLLEFRRLERLLSRINLKLLLKLMMNRCLLYWLLIFLLHLALELLLLLLLEHHFLIALNVLRRSHTHHLLVHFLVRWKGGQILVAKIWLVHLRKQLVLLIIAILLFFLLNYLVDAKVLA